MTRPLIYIAGPFRGPTPYDVRKNVEAARDLGLRVAQAGAYPVIPHTMTADFDKQLTDEFRLDGTLELLRRCDAMALTPDWQRSSGAQTERAWARGVLMPIYEFTPGCEADLNDFVAYVTSRQYDGIDYRTWGRGVAQP